MEWGVILYPGVAQPEGDPSDWVEPVWLEAWQNLSTWLMPIYDPRLLYGDIANMPYLSLQLHANAHFGPDGTGNVPEPGSFNITVKSGDFEIRRPL